MENINFFLILRQKKKKKKKKKNSAVTQVKKYMEGLCSEDSPKSNQTKKAGLNTGAVPFQPSSVQPNPLPLIGVPEISNADSSLTVFEIVSLQIEAVKEENSILELDPLIMCRVECRPDAYETILQQKERELGEQISKQNRKQRVQIDMLEEKIDSLMVARDMELVLRGYQLHNIHGMLRDIIQRVPESVPPPAKLTPPKEKFLWDLEGWDPPKELNSTVDHWLEPS